MSEDAEHKLSKLAREGDLDAIASILKDQFKNSDLQIQRIRVSQRHQHLGILLEANNVPDCEISIQILSQCLVKLKPKGIQGFKVFGRQKDVNVPAWRRDIELIVKSLERDHISLIDWMSQGTGIPISDKSQLYRGFDATETDLVVGEARRYLRFYFNVQETALVPLDRIDEVLQVSRASILPMPNMPESVIGICNCRGSMLWLVDLGQQLGFSSSMAGMLEISAVVVVREAERRIGLVVPHIVDIESYLAQDLQPPAKELFPPNLLQFMEGYLTRSSSPVLDVRTITCDHRLQVHSYVAA
jgi:positive phototaxis protein PixI